MRIAGYADARSAPARPRRRRATPAFARGTASRPGGPARRRRRPADGATDHVGGEPIERRGRRVLELGGDDGARRAPGGRARPASSYGGDEVDVGDRAGGRRRVGVEHDRPVAHRAGRRRRCSGRAGRRRARRSSPAGRSGVTSAVRRQRRWRRGVVVAGGAVGVERGGERRVVGGEQRDGEQRGVRRPGLADGERGDRDAGRHLHDRQQRVLSLQVARRHRHAEHGHRRLGGEHPGQVGGAAGAGDDRPQPRSRAVSAKANISSGMRWALTTLASCGDAEPRRARRRRRAIVDQSLAEPITTATSGPPRAGVTATCRSLTVRWTAGGSGLIRSTTRSLLISAP